MASPDASSAAHPARATTFSRCRSEGIAPSPAGVCCERPRLLPSCRTDTQLTATFAWSAQKHPFMNLTTCFCVLSLQGRQASLKRETEMRNLILSAASALALASPAVASDLPVTSYSESYARSYEYRTSPPVVVEESAPVVSETLVVRRPVIVAPPRVVVEDYPVYATPRVYAAPRVYAYAGPGWRGGWGHRRHFHGGW